MSMLLSYLLIKFNENLSTIFWVILLTDRQTDRHANLQKWKHYSYGEDNDGNFQYGAIVEDFILY